MKKPEKKISDADIARLLALKTFERPDEERAEKNIQNIMRSVRTTGNMPTLLLFPEKGLGWAFAQPRYGIAALFVLFLGLHLMERPMPSTQQIAAGAAIQAPSPAESVVAVAVDTNRHKAIQFQSVTPSLYSTFSDPAGTVLTSYGE